MLLPSGILIGQDKILSQIFNQLDVTDVPTELYRSLIKTNQIDKALELAHSSPKAKKNQALNRLIIALIEEDIKKSKTVDILEEALQSAQAIVNEKDKSQALFEIAFSQFNRIGEADKSFNIVRLLENMNYDNNERSYKFY